MKKFEFGFSEEEIIELLENSKQKMETKTIVIGNNTINNTQFIKFYKKLDVGFRLRSTDTKPHEYKYLELICKNYTSDRDLIFAYFDPDNRCHGTLYIGKWNDGIVEQ